jgi:hypothetical protein
VLANDSDPDGDALAVTALSTPANGTVLKNADGSVTYTAKSGFVGTDTFTYQATDGAANSNTATVTVQVTALTNSAPVAKNDTATTNKGVPVTIAVLANDTDPDGDLLSVKSFSQPANGSVSVNASGVFTYTPKAGFAGTDTFTYVVSDGTTTSNTATVTIQVVNRPPVAVNDTASTSKGTTVRIPVLANDSDPDGDALTVVGLTQPVNGTLTLNPDGTVSYTPKKGFTGTDSFTYKASDGTTTSNTATVTITVK